MTLQAKKMLELLPNTDCKKCGHQTCLVFATELSQRQASIDACPDITENAKRILTRIASAERSLLSALQEIKWSDAKSVLSLVREVFIVIPVRIMGLLLFTFPLSLPIWILIVWLLMK